ncbi:hypothetical protein ACHAPT_001065 [Fusarium lateritium]
MSHTGSDDDEVDHIDLTHDDNDDSRADLGNGQRAASTFERLVLGFDRHGDAIPETINNDELIDVDVQEIAARDRHPSRVREESSLFLPNDMTPLATGIGSMDVDVQEISAQDRHTSRVREESSLFVSSVTPPATGIGPIDLTDEDGERAGPANSGQAQGDTPGHDDPRGRAESSLFVSDDMTPLLSPSSQRRGGSSEDPEEIESDQEEVEQEEARQDEPSEYDSGQEDDDLVQDEEMNDAEEEQDEAMPDADNPEEEEQVNTGGDPDDGDDNPEDDGSGDNDSSSDEENSDNEEENSDNGSDNQDAVPSDAKNPNASLEEALDEEFVYEPDWAEQCLITCKPHWDRVANLYLRYRRRFLNKRIELRNTKANHRQTVRELKLQIRQLEGIVKRRRRRHHKTWRKAACLWVERGQAYGRVRSWQDIYKLSCKEENMSWAFRAQKPPKTHPDLKLRPPECDEEEDEEEMVTIPEEALDERPGLSLDHRSSPERPPSPVDAQPSLFERMELKLQIKVLSYLLIFNKELVHVISRLDPYHQPSQLHRNCRGKVALLHRFHVGSESVSLTFGALHPQKLLAPLLVSKHFNYLGASLFYGANTLQHLQHVELLWIGSQAITYKPDDKGRYTSRRTHHLAWLSEARRLKSIAVHIPESSKAYMRRRHEPPHIVDYMADKTAEQPNYRRFRALRTMQGLDYLHVLRGLNGVTFWDYDQWLDLRSKAAVRDWTFVRDVNAAVRRDKTPEDLRFCKLRRLAPLVIRYRPRNEIMTEIEAFVNQYSPGFGGHVIDLTLDEE